MMSSIQQLHEIAQRCLRGMPLDDGLARWLGTSHDQFLKHRARTIEDAMGLRFARGGVPWWMEEAIRKRDAALRELARRFYSGLPASVQAREIQRLAVRYASSVWLRERDAVAPPPAHEGTRLQWLWAAFKAGAAMPLGERQLRHVLGACAGRPRLVRDALAAQSVALHSASQCQTNAEIIPSTRLSCRDA